jgi:large subunit ribosomal protein L21
MYAVIELCGKQYKVAQGDEFLVDRLDLDEGKTLSLTPLLLGGETRAITADELKGSKVKAKVEEHLLGDKIRVFKYKPKSGYRRTKGHRSRLSRVTIQTITAAGGKKAETKTEAKAEAKPAAKAEKTETKAPKAAAKTAKAETKSAKPDTKPAKADTKSAKPAKSAKKDTKPEKE